MTYFISLSFCRAQGLFKVLTCQQLMQTHQWMLRETTNGRGCLHTLTPPFIHEQEPLQ